MSAVHRTLPSLRFSVTMMTPRASMQGKSLNDSSTDKLTDPQIVAKVKEHYRSIGETIGAVTQARMSKQRALVLDDLPARHARLGRLGCDSWP